MKKHYLWVFLLLCTTLIYAQEWEQHVISTSVIEARGSRPVDLDQDGDLDIIVEEAENYQLWWFENEDGAGNFAPIQLINNNPILYIDIEFVDMDNDNDLDIVYLENNPRLLNWLEHIDGQGQFAPPQIIYEANEGFIESFTLFDMDEDDDPDPVLVVDDDFFDRIVWLENDGAQNWEDPILIEEELMGAVKPVFVDVDEDGLIDMLTSTELPLPPAQIVWYRNTGNMVLEAAQVIYQFQLFNSDYTHIWRLEFEDLTGDGHPEIVATTHNDETDTYVYVLKNLNLQGLFADPQIIPNAIPNYNLGDLNGDGMSDVVFYADEEIYWLKTLDNTIAFGGPHLVTTQVDWTRDAQVADIDGDGLPDIVSASWNDNKVAWYSNPGNLGTDNFSANQLTLYPNPAKDKVFLETTLPVSNVRLMNTLGQAVDIELVNGSLDLSALASGIYLLEATFSDGQTQVQRLLIQ